MNIILMAIPGFFILIALEMLINHLRGTVSYGLINVITPFLMGLLSQFPGVFIHLFPFFLLSQFPAHRTFYIFVAPF